MAARQSSVLASYKHHCSKFHVEIGYDTEDCPFCAVLAASVGMVKKCEEALTHLSEVERKLRATAATI